MNKVILVAVCTVLLYSCKAYFTARYKLNQRFEFKERKEYIRFLEKEKGMDIADVIYPEPGSFVDIIVNHGGSGIYFGCFKNDSTELVKSKFLEDNLSCIGRVLKEIEKDALLASKGMDTLVTRSDFGKYRFRYLLNDELFRLNTSRKKLKLVLVFTYSSGTYYDAFYKEVSQFRESHKDEIDLFIITLDDVSKLQ